MEKLVSADCLMKQFKVKRPQLGFNGALEVGIMNIIPFHLIHNIQPIGPFVFNLNRSLVPQYGINMLWDFLVWNKHALGISFHPQEKNRFYQRYFLECFYVLV